MPKPRYGTIPPTRLSQARSLKDFIHESLGDHCRAFVSIFNGGFCVRIRLYEDSPLKEEDWKIGSLSPALFGPRIKRVSKT